MIRGWSPRVPKCLLACPSVVVHFDLVGTAPNDYRSFQFIISGNYKIYFPLLTQASLASPSVLYAIVAWLGFNALRVVVNVAPVATFCILCTYAVTLPCASGILVAIAFTPLGLAWISFSQWGFKKKAKWFWWTKYRNTYWCRAPPLQNPHDQIGQPMNGNCWFSSTSSSLTFRVHIRTTQYKVSLT